MCTGGHVEIIKSLLRNEDFHVDRTVGEIGHDGHRAAGITAHPGKLPVCVEMLGRRVRVHQVEGLALRENGIGRRNPHQPAILLVHHGFLHGQVARQRAPDGRYRAIIENGGASVHAAEALRFHPPLSVFLTEVQHEGSRVEEQRDCQCRHAGLGAAGEEIGRQTLFVVVLQEVEHLGLMVADELPLLRQAGSRPLALHNAPQGIVETGLVVQETETRTAIQPVVVLVVDFCDEKQVGVRRTKGGDGPREKFGGHEFHHIAAEAVHPLLHPELQDG